LAYDWPGNVRELENVIKRLTILSEGPVVSFDDLPENIQNVSGSHHPDKEVIINNELNLNEAVQDYEKRIILEALEKTNWVKSKAAKLLNINRTTLVAKIKKQNIETNKAASA
jgi:sigma-54 specific flagellar transcriptional regulator A